MSDLKDIAKFFFETGQLKRVKRSGWWLIGINNPESVAEHSFRAAMIGYVLADMEKADTNKVVKICLFNDFHEARINDLHKVGQRYVDFKKAEKKAFTEQMERMPKNIAKELNKLFDEFQNDGSKEGIVARDADLLENFVQAKEYYDHGYKEAKDWMTNIKKVVKTKSAKQLIKVIEKTNSSAWWKGLKKITR